MRSLLTAGFALCAVLTATAPARATYFHLKTFDNLVVNGTTHTVSFLDVALASLSGSAQTPAFTTPAAAQAALDAILAASWYPGLAVSVQPASPFVSVFVPFSAAYARNAAPGDTMLVYNGIGATPPAPLFGVAQLPDGFQIDATHNYNVDGFTIALFDVAGDLPALVPEPASMAVLALGLFGAGLLRRRTA